jgi:tRNA pseudouridine38-40 synthase
MRTESMPLQRYKLIVAYRGTRYHGWQRQPMVPSYKGDVPKPGEGIPTIQETLGRAMMTVLKHRLKLSGSSRTDSGVHAKGQLIHFDTDQTQIPIEGMRQAVNARLPDDILVRSIEPVERSFDAVRSTIGKRYQYAIWNAIDRPLFFADLAWHRWQPLDVAAMIRAAEVLVGEHDFASFCKPGHGRSSTVRTLRACEVSQRGPRLVIGVEGSGFLWQMVRIIVGTLVEVGMGRRNESEMSEMLAAKDRRAAGPTAPPHGLYLQWIRTGRRVVPAIEVDEEGADL